MLKGGVLFQMALKSSVAFFRRGFGIQPPRKKKFEILICQNYDKIEISSQKFLLFFVKYTIFWKIFYRLK